MRTHLSLKGEYVQCRAGERSCPRGGHQEVDVPPGQMKQVLRALTEEYNAQEAGGAVPAAMVRGRTIESKVPATGGSEGKENGISVETSTPVDSPYYDAEKKRYISMNIEDQAAYQRHARATVAKLTKGQQAALKRYSTESFMKINQHLRGAEGAKPVSAAVISNLDKAIENGGDGQEKVLYRGFRISMPQGTDVESMSDEEVAAIVEEQFTPGSVMEDAAYFSTSVNPMSAAHIAGRKRISGFAPSVGVIFELSSSQGRPVPNEDWWDEAEVLLPRNSKFSVDEIHYDRKMGELQSDCIIISISHGE